MSQTIASSKADIGYLLNFYYYYSMYIWIERVYFLLQLTLTNLHCVIWLMKDSINVVEAIEIDKVVTYKLTTTVMLDMNVASEQAGATSLAGSLTRQVGRYQCCNIIHTLTVWIATMCSLLYVFSRAPMPIHYCQSIWKRVSYELLVRSCVLLPLMYLSIQGGVDDQLDRTEDAHLQHRPHDRGHGDGHAFKPQRALYSKDQRGGKFSSNSQQR